MEKKHFSYEANIYLEPKEEIKEEIKDIKFLSPINVILSSGKNVIASVDLIHRQIYLTDSNYNNNDFKQSILNFIDKKTSLPEDLYEASQEVYDSLSEAQERRRDIENFAQEEEE